MGDLYNPFPKLPKHIRQIGDPDHVVRLYLEDYVNTYLKRLYPTGKELLRVGLLLGSAEQYDGMPYIFVDGAMEMEGVEIDREKISFTEGAWKKAYQEIERAFPRRTIQGWFLCGGPGSQLSPLNYWKQHGRYFAGKNQLMYLNHGLEGEESIYITSEDGFYRLKGHCIYYERNQMMQDYMVTRKDVRRVETGSHEKVIKDFRQRMTARQEQAAARRNAVGALGMACGVLSVAVLAGGVTLFNNYHKMQQMESVLTSVLPVGVSDWEEYRKQQAEEPDFIIEEMPGNVLPLESPSGETGEFYEAETMTPESDAFSGNESQTPEASSDGTGSGTDGEETAADTAADSGLVEEAVPEEETAAQQKLVGMDKGNGQGDAADGGQPAVDYEAAAANGYRVYQVGEGETLYGICWSVYGNLAHLSEICSLNGLADENRILAGQKLILP